MSYVIEDMNPSQQTYNVSPYALLANLMQNGIFGKISHVVHTPRALTITASEVLAESVKLVTRLQLSGKQVALGAKILLNNQYFVINSSEIRKNLCRAFIKTTHEVTCRCCISAQGEILVKFHTFLTESVVLGKERQIVRVYKYLQKVYITFINKCVSIMQKMKVFLNPLSQKLIETNQAILQRLDIVKNTCRFCYVKPAFLQSNGERGKSNFHNLPMEFIEESEMNLSRLFDMKLESVKMVDDVKLTYFIELWEASLNLHKVVDTNMYDNYNLIKIKGIYKKNLKMPEFENNKIMKNYEIDRILSQVYIKDIQKVRWEKIYEGAFGALFRSIVQLHYVYENQNELKNCHEKPIQRHLILKIGKANKRKINKVEVEKCILEAIRDEKCKFLPVYYKTSQQIMGSLCHVLLDFYPLKSLECWIQNFSLVTSLQSRVSILLNICYGLKFLHQNQIVHRDLKASNVLINSKMIAKITDFGQSYHEQVLQYFRANSIKQPRPGFTIPYSPPEAFCKDLEFCKKPSYDMYSLGFLIYEIAFNQPLLAGCNIDTIRAMYQQQSRAIDERAFQEHNHKVLGRIRQKMYLVSEKMSDLGPSEILSPLLNLVERCMDLNIDNRPHLEWVLNVLRETSTNLTDFYQF